MKSRFRFLASPSRCGYLPDQIWRLEYEMILSIEPTEYHPRIEQGWRRFGRMLFRPMCPACRACRSLRVDVARFQPSRSQKRAQHANAGIVAATIGEPRFTAEKLSLFQRFHDSRSQSRGWPLYREDAEGFMESFLDNPVQTEEWQYRMDGKLIGLGYVDRLRAGLSAIYFVHEPAETKRSLGTWNILSLIQEAKTAGLPHVYLGYHVPNCISLNYKANFRPYELLGRDGRWHPSSEDDRPR